MSVVVEVNNTVQNPEIYAIHACIGEVGRDRTGRIYARVRGGVIEVTQSPDGTHDCIVYSAEDEEWDDIRFTPDSGLRARIIIERV